MAKKEELKKTYASTEIPTVAAAVDGLLRLESQSAAEAFLDNIAEHHIIAREQVPSKGKSLTLWIRGYDVLPDEAKEGATGNFAVLAIRKVSGRWSIYPTKIPLDAAKHPQRRYVKRGKHPNFAHPLIRAIQGGKIYESAEEAHEDLALLHEQYPGASIPTSQKLYLMIYSRGESKANPMQKYVLEPTVNAQGQFYIDMRVNKHNEKARSLSTNNNSKPAEVKTTNAAKGKFTAREQLKRKKKPQPKRMIDAKDAVDN